MLIKKNRTDEEKLYWRAERGDLEKCTGHGAFLFSIKKNLYWGLLREAQPHKKICTEARAARSEIKKNCAQ